MSEQREGYSNTTTEARTTFDLSHAEMNLILRLRQHRGMIIVDADSMTMWPASKPEYCNGKRYRLPFDLPEMG